MKSIKLIHIGDVHYPDIIDAGPQVDVKDEGFDSGFVKKVAPNQFIEVGNGLVCCLEDEDIQGLLFSGDLTSRGLSEYYKICVDYFNSLIVSVEKSSGKQFEIHVVPGNHDLKRKNLTTGSLEERFTEFEQVWKNIGREVFPVKEIKKNTVFNNGVEINVVSLNTCLGCGESYNKFPEKIKQAFEELLQNSDLENKDEFRKFCEELDTPAIDIEHLAEITRDIQRGNETSISLILGHHALLPQPTVRLALYTELLNGGSTRMALSTLNSPVIYCHGHIHQDPIEIVSKPGDQDSNLLLISAPEYRNGFNVIEVSYTEIGFPIGVSVTPYRIESFGHLRKKNSIDIPIRKPQNLIKYCDEDTEKVYQIIGGDGVRFNALLALTIEKGLRLDSSRIENILIELEWMQVIKIANKSYPSRRWMISRVGL